MEVKTIMRFVIAIICTAAAGLAQAENTMRQTALEWTQKAGLGNWLNVPVKVTMTESGVLAATDEGVYIVQYNLETPQVAAEPNVVIDASVKIPVTVDKAVIVTHGWIDKAQRDWPQTMAEAIRQKTDPNEWVCGCFGWSGGSAVITSIHAARYARDIAGPRLAAAILKLPTSIRHIHLIGHSAGSWTIESAARRIAKDCPGTSLHLTFLDAYVPQDWDPNELGKATSDPNQPADIWAEHYYTRDITYVVTQLDLAGAHNVDITAIDPLVAEHEFPYRWYLATITGDYRRWDEKGHTVVKTNGECEYGFARSREMGLDNWQKSKTLPRGNPAVKIEPTK